MTMSIAFTDGSKFDNTDFLETETAISDKAEIQKGGVQTPVTTNGVAQPATQPAQVAQPATQLVSKPAPVDASRFEGSAVGVSEIKISGAVSIDAADLTVSLDDLVRAVGVYRVVKVNHYVHPKTGETVRQQVLAPVEDLIVVPFNSADPNDDGIVRARP